MGSVECPGDREALVFRPASLRRRRYNLDLGLLLSPLSPSSACLIVGETMNVVLSSCWSFIRLVFPHAHDSSSIFQVVFHSTPLSSTPGGRRSFVRSQRPPWFVWSRQVMGPRRLKGPGSAVRKLQRGRHGRGARGCLGRGGLRKSHLRSEILFLWPLYPPCPLGMIRCALRK